MAALVAIPQGDDWRIIHDGTHYVKVNSGIKVRDQEASPMHADLTASLGAEVASSSQGIFSMVFDVSKAHRRVGILEQDLGLQACSLLPPRRHAGARRGGLVQHGRHLRHGQRLVIPAFD